MHLIKIHHYVGQKVIAYIDVDKILFMDVRGRNSSQGNYGRIYMEGIPGGHFSVKEHTFQRVLGLWRARAVYHARMAMSMLPNGLVDEED